MNRAPLPIRAGLGPKAKPAPSRVAIAAGMALTLSSLLLASLLLSSLLLTSLLLTSLLPSPAAALPGSPAGLEKGYDPETAEKKANPVFTIGSGATGVIFESEPNDTCPGQPVACGDVITASLSPAGDVDAYTFSADAGACLALLTQRISGQTVDTDTKIELLNADCSTVLASDDDSGPGLFAWIANFSAPYTGTYVVRVQHLMPTETGDYQLLVSCNPEAPVNATCQGATALPCGDFNIEGSTFCSGNDLNLPNGPASCTGFSSGGQDVVYSMQVQMGAILNATYVSDGDASFYILEDCSDAATCLAGSDHYLVGSAENLSYTFPADGTYYLVVDTFGTNSAGRYTLSGNFNCSGVPVQPTTWGLIKARFVGD